MTLTAEQKEELITNLKKQYAESKEYYSKAENRAFYANMPHVLADIEQSIERIKELYERLESGDEIDLGNGFNDGRNVAWLFLAFATLCGFGNNKKDGE